MPSANEADMVRMRDQLFFEGDDVSRRLSRFWMLLVLAGVIASAGVVSNSTATVIGAMIVAPLMVPILGVVVAVVLGDRDNLLRCLGLVVLGAAAVVAIGYLVGLCVEAPVTAATNPQVASRVAPTLIELVAALATGAVGSIALARDDISDTLPGVAIAISLVPPLAVVGLTLESGVARESLGALVLFVANVSAILASGLVVMAVFRVHRLAVAPADERRRVHRVRAAVVIAVALVAIAIPLGLASARINTNRTRESTVSKVAASWADGQGWEIISVSTEPAGTVIRAAGPLPEPDTAALKQDLIAAGLENQRIRIELVPSNTVVLTSGG
ncbi:DUF389 domain-containing protein [Aquihabitans sp. McL0605]|uniref:DUF389 domain-containing protein n=1 Tax=Aquihabitans sp. McL0605 TaxID=3415671 RepID=UPI003CE73A07